jgi:hypothetical protein
MYWKYGLGFLLRCIFPGATNGSRAAQARAFYRKRENDPEFPLFDGGVMNVLRILTEKVSV